MKIRPMFVLFALFWLNIHGQEFSVDASPQSVKCLPGVPDSIGLTITNVSGKDIWIAGKSLKDGVSIGLPSLTNEKGEDFSCIPPSDQSMIVSSPDAPIVNKVSTRKGESWSMSSGSFGEEFCPLTKDLTGVRKVKFVLTVKVAEGPLVKDIRKVKIVGEVAVDFLKPEGEDLAYIKAVQDWLSKADPKEINGYTAQVKPLTWGELLSSSRIPVPQMLLTNYPTSTYAAYLVYDRLKGFASADFANPMFLRSLETGLFLSNSYPTEGGWVWMKDEMNAAWWSKWAGIILKNHPDIWFADELRLKLAMNQVALKNYQAAEADFIKLSKEAKPYVAEKAGLFVQIMKQKGWVSAPVEKSVPEGKDGK